MTDTKAPVELSTMRVSPSQSRANARVDSILKAAKEHLAEVGRDRFSLGPVQKKAGCSVGTIYRYFEDRVALLNAIDPTGSVQAAAAPIDDTTALALNDMRVWCEKMIEKGAGKGDLKTAGTAFLKLMTEKGLL